MLRQHPLPRPDRQLCCVAQRPSVELCAARNVAEACASAPAPYYSMPPVLAGHSMQRPGGELRQLAESCRARVVFSTVVQPYNILPYPTLPCPTLTLFVSERRHAATAGPYTTLTIPYPVCQ